MIKWKLFISLEVDNFMEDILTIANKKFSSRLIVGTGKYKNFEETANAIKASGADIVTVAVRRVNILDKNQPLLMDYIDPKSITYLPNTAGCFSSEEALRTLRLAREMGNWKLVKLEVLGDKKTLYPNMVETIKCTEILVREGFDVMVYCTDDPTMTKKLEDVGACAIMPLGSPIGSGIGIQNKKNISLIKEQSSVPVIVDAGIGTASDATIAMELGCDGVLLNTAIAEARNPILMAEAMKYAVVAGRQAFKAKRMRKRYYASPSSPIKNLI
jgi:thiazole synthase